MAPFAVKQSPISAGAQAGDLAKTEARTRRCKVLCTAGPKCWDEATLLRLLDEGMDACCLDFSRGDHEEHAATLCRIRQAVAKRPHSQLAIILDIKSPVIRTGFLKDGRPVDLKAGASLKLVTNYSFQGDETCISVSCAQLPTLVKPGSRILCANGSLSLEVVSCRSRHVMTKIVNDFRLGEQQNVCLPGVRMATPADQGADTFLDCVGFGIPQGVDYVAASYVQSGAEVRLVREVLGERGRHIRVLAKIQCEAALRHFDDILRASDGIVLARGELGMEIPYEKVFLAQKMVIAKCNAAGKPVIIAGQLLDSMTVCGRPTRAEAADVANAVLDGTDGLMLVEETAHGNFPEAAVRLLGRACEEAEAAQERGARPPAELADGPAAAACRSAAEAADSHRAKVLLVLTETGRGAQLLAQRRPRVPILAVTGSDFVARQLQVSRGVEVLLMDTAQDPKLIFESALKIVEQGGLVQRGDMVVMVHGIDEKVEEEANVADEEEANKAKKAGATKVRSAGEVLTRVIGQSGFASPSPVASASPKAAGPVVEQAKIMLKESLSSLATPQQVLQALLAASEDSSTTLHAFGEAHSLGVRKCKIICTISPSCNVKTLVDLIDAGMDICRLNFSYGDHAAHAAVVSRVREAASQRPGRQVAIQVDTKGPEIRTGLLKDSRPVQLQAGQELKLVTDPGFRGDASCVAVTYRRLPTAVSVGMNIYIAHGRLALEVLSCGLTHVVTRVLNDFTLGERQNVNLPGVHLDLPVLQLKDRDDLLNFAVPKGVDFVAASFVQSAADVRFVREVLGQKGKAIRIIAKIENVAGLRCIDEILQESDGIMVGRGDLGMEIPMEKVVLAQKLIIRKCNAAGKPVITATQMLESMTGAPRPTRAEASDVANAVLDGTDCVMLSAETASGSFPVEAVRAMGRMCEEAEAAIDYGSLFWSLSEETHLGSKDDLVATAAVETAVESDASAILLFAATQEAALRLARLRPPMPVVAVTGDARVARQLQALRGVLPVHVELLGTEQAEEVTAEIARKEAVRVGALEESQKLVAMRGMEVKVMDPPPSPEVQGTMDAIVDATKGAPRDLLHMSLKAAVQALSWGVFCNNAARYYQNLVRLMSKTFLEANIKDLGIVALPSGLQYRVLRAGEGKETPAESALCVCRYEVHANPQWPYGSPTTDSCAGNDFVEVRPYEVAGWGPALELMVEGDKWEICIPPDLAQHGDGGIQLEDASASPFVVTLELVKITGARQHALELVDEQGRVLVAEPEGEASPGITTPTEDALADVQQPVKEVVRKFSLLGEETMGISRQPMKTTGAAYKVRELAQAIGA